MVHSGKGGGNIGRKNVTVSPPRVSTRSKPFVNFLLVKAVNTLGGGCRAWQIIIAISFWSFLVKGDDPRRKRDIP